VGRSALRERASGQPLCDVAQAVIEVTDQPHTGCAKFNARFGVEAHRFVNSEVGEELHLRGIDARVVTPGTIRQGDSIRKI
jgi:MOSC domain-containing protein YiiM